LSVPRVLLAPSHRTGLACAVAAAVAEIVGRQERQVRYHHLGVSSPADAWDRWEGSSFLDPSLYDKETLLRLYELTTRGADLSLLASTRGLFDTREGASWTPADAARTLDAPVVLVVDCRGWGSGLAGLVAGFNEQRRDAQLSGVLLTGVEDRAHRETLRTALGRTNVPVVGCLYAGDAAAVGLSWEGRAPGAWEVPLGDDLLDVVFRQVDVPGLETIAGQRGFLLGSRPRVNGHGDVRADAPLVLVAAGRGFTPWSRDGVEILRAAGARVRRLDLIDDDALPEETAGLVVAGHLWPDTLGELAQNYGLMRHMRVRVADGLPTLALGGGALYFLKRLQDASGRSHELAGILPGTGEMIGGLDEVGYLDVRAERDSVLLRVGETLAGWVAGEAEIQESPVSRNFPLSVTAPGWAQRQLEGAATGDLLCSRVLVHLASQPLAAARFVAACTRFAKQEGLGG
jgi:cobyrinic acid a,c-diamide synthase